MSGDRVAVSVWKEREDSAKEGIKSVIRTMEEGKCAREMLRVVGGKIERTYDKHIERDNEKFYEIDILWKK